MFYLMMNSTFFNLWFYIIGHLVKDDSDRQRGNPLLLVHGLLFLISSKVSFICTIPPERIVHTTAFATPVVEHWQEQEIAQWVLPRRINSTNYRTMSECSTMELHFTHWYWDA